MGDEVTYDFLTSARSHFASNDLEALTKLINAEMAAKERGETRTTAREFNVAFDLETQLKRKGQAA